MKTRVLSPLVFEPWIPIIIALAPEKLDAESGSSSGRFEKESTQVDAQAPVGHARVHE